MRLIMRPVVIATILLLGLPTIVEPVSAKENTATPKLARRPPHSLEQHPESDAVIADLHKSGAAGVSIERWPRERYFSSEFVEPVRLACSLAQLASYRPHRLGVIDLMSLAAPTLNDFSRLTEFDEALFGCDEDCTVELWDSPSLVANLKLVSRLPELRKVTVYTKRTDGPFLKAIRQVQASEVKQRDPADRALKSGLVQGIVVDSNGKPVAGATVIIHATDGKIVIGGSTNDDGIFSEYNIRNVPYRIEAFAPPPWLAGRNAKVASSEPVNAKPGDANVRLVINPARLAPQPPDFDFIVEDDDGRRAVFDSSDWPDLDAPAQWQLISPEKD